MKRDQIRRIAFFLLKLAGTIFFLWWALSSIGDKRQLISNFEIAMKSPGWVATGFLFALISLVASAFRWFFLLRAQGISESIAYILRLTLYAAFFNIASLGGAAGDAAKIVLLIRRHPQRKTGVAISVMIDHVIGFFSSGLIFLFFTWILGAINLAEDSTGRDVFIAATWFQIIALIGVFLSILSCAPFMLVYGRRWLPRLTNNKWIVIVTQAIDLHRTGWRYGLFALGASFVLSATYYLSFYAGIRALGADVAAGTMMAVMPIVDVITALPISISGLGVRERTFDFLIGKLSGIDTATAVAGSLLGFLFTTFWGLVGGLAIIAARPSKKPVTDSEK